VNVVCDSTNAFRDASQSANDASEVFVEACSPMGMDEASSLLGAKDDVMTLTMEHLSVKDRISQILERLEGLSGGIEFSALFDTAPDRLEVITTFLAILELMKMQALKVYQNVNFSTLYVYAVTDEETPAEPPLEEQLQE
jgi:hypothetical protein